jgi:hypothetical protein
MAPLKKNEKKPSLLSTMLINRFDGSCGTFGEGKKKPIVVNKIGSICSRKKIKNDHGVDVSTIITI